MTKNIIILGAGPTGLGAGYRLKELGHKCWHIYEKNDYVGGLSASVSDGNGFTWDIGGHIIFSKNEEYNKLVDVLLGDEALKHKRDSWIWLEDQFIRYPFQNNFQSLKKDVVLECVSGLVDNIGVNCCYNNFEEWIKHQFGVGISKNFMIPYNSKVWKIPLNKMDYRWIDERVSLVDIKNVLKNIIYCSDDGGWGPNNLFTYPLHGGIGGLFNKFLPYVKQNLTLNKEAVEIDIKNKKVCFENDEDVFYDKLISTIPLNLLLDNITKKPESISKVADKLICNSGYMVGIGFNKPCPSDKNWIYFPQDDSPFYRVTYLSNYSPNTTPNGDYFSLLTETAYSNFMPVSKADIVEQTITGLINSKFICESDREHIASEHITEVPYLFPVPFLGRDEVLKTIMLFLEENNIYSRGRFGGWKYEIGNMDHSVMQGMEIVDRVVLDGGEVLYKW